MPACIPLVHHACAKSASLITKSVYLIATLNRNGVQQTLNKTGTRSLHSAEVLNYKKTLINDVPLLAQFY